MWSLDGKHLLALVRLNEGVTAAGSVVETLHVQVWDAATGQRVRSFPVTQPVKPQASGQLQSTTYLPALNVPYLAMGKLNETYGNNASSSQVIEIWDVATGQMIATFGKEDHSPNHLFQGKVWAPDHRRLVTFGYDDAGTSTVWQIWDAPTGQKMRSLILKDTQLTSRVVWLPDGKSIASGLDVYDVETGRNITTYHLDQGSLDAVAWSPNGKRIAVNSFSEGHRLPFLDALFAVGSDTGGSETLFILNASDGRQLAKYDNRPGLYLSHFVLLLQIAFDRGS